MSRDEQAPQRVDGTDPLTAYEARSAPTMVALSLTFVVLYAVQVLWIAMPTAVLIAVGVAQLSLWLVFWGDFIHRARLSSRPWRFVLTHPLDLAMLVLPMLRPLRILRIFAAARLLIDRGGFVAFGHVGGAIGASAFFIALVGALTVLQFERAAPGASITTFGAAIWWAFVTMTTVGYGDVYPVTAGGKVAAVMMMAVGISLIGVVTASIAGWFTQRLAGEQDDAIAALTVEVRLLREQVGLLGTGQPPADADGVSP